MRFRRPSRPESYALDTTPYKVLRCAPTARIRARLARVISSCNDPGVGVRETLTAPRPSAVSGNYVMAERLKPLSRVTRW